MRLAGSGKKQHQQKKIITSGTTGMLRENQWKGKAAQRKTGGKRLREVFNGTTITCTLLYCLLKMCTIMADEVFPVWARTSQSLGGLALEPARIAIPLSISGVALMLFQLFGYYRLDRRFGPLKMFKIGTVGASLLIAYIPFSQYLYIHLSPAVFWVVISILYVLRSCFVSSAFTAISILVNNSSMPSTIGLVNGAAQSAGSLFSAIAPMTASSMFAYFSTSGFGFPLDYHFVFLATAVIFGSLAIPVFFLPASAAQRRKESV